MLFRPTVRLNTATHAQVSCWHSRKPSHDAFGGLIYGAPRVLVVSTSRAGLSSAPYCGRAEISDVRMCASLHRARSLGKDR